MNQPPLDRAAFLRTLRRCHTEEQLFSRLTFACLAQYDEAQRPELLDDVRGAAYSLRLPAVEYKTDQCSTGVRTPSTPTATPFWPPPTPRNSWSSICWI